MSASLMRDRLTLIINPSNPLAAKVSKCRGSVADLLGNAEEMLAEMTDDFVSLVDETVARLPDLYEQWAIDATRDSAISVLIPAARMLKGKCGSFGFPLVGKVADLFCDYLCAVPPERQDPAVILNYVETLQMVWKQRISGDGGVIWHQIVANLTRINELASPGASDERG